MNSARYRSVVCLTLIALLGFTQNARAQEQTSPLDSAHHLKVAGFVLLSIAGALSIASFAAGGVSYYYNTGNHWQNGNEDTGPAVGGIAAGLGLASLTVALIGLPLALVGRERESRLRSTQRVRASLNGLSVRF
jgi:hypothetical protein